MNLNLRGEEDDMVLRRSKPALVKPSEVSRSATLSGKNIVFTGKIPGKTRHEMLLEAKSLGAYVQSGVIRSTDILVCASHTLDRENRKYKAAIKYDVEIINHEAYERIIAHDNKQSTVNPETERTTAINNVARRR